MIKKFNISEYKDSRSSHAIVLDRNYQTLRCNACSNWLHLEITQLHCLIEDILVRVNELPTLVCSSCSRHYLPHLSKLIIGHYVKQAKEQKALGVNLTRLKKTDEKKFDYCKSVSFKYSSMDYYYIPGLQRSWSDGYLTPVFFEKEVLLKYLYDPSYSVEFATDTFGSVYKDKEHLIAFGLNRYERVITWLGDLDKLEEKEQQYFLSFNIDSDHNLGSGFYLSQIDAEFGELSKEENLLKLRSDFQQACLQKFNLKIFQDSIDVNQLMRGILKPIMWNEKGIGNVVNNLHKVCIEAINVSQLKKRIQATEPMLDISRLRGLKLLELWIKINVNGIDSSKVMAPFFVLNDLRTVLDHLVVGKRKKQMLESCNTRLGLLNSDLNYKSMYDSLISSISDSYQKLCQ